MIIAANRMAGPLVVAALLGASPAVANPATPGAAEAARSPIPPDGSFFRVTVDGGVSPFTSVSHDVTVRGRTVVVTLQKESLCRQGQRERVRLLDGPEAAAVLAALADAGAWSVAAPPGAVHGRARDTAAPRDAPRWEVWYAWGREMRRFHVDERTLLASAGVLAVVTAVREAVASRVEPLPMRDAYHPADRVGFLTMTASEPARAVLDGWDAFRLPVDGLDVAEGEHKVRVEGTSGKRREFTVRVVAGTGTHVHVVLE